MNHRIVYQPGNSSLHRIHPLVKILWLVFLSVIIFVDQDIRIILLILFSSLIAFTLLKYPLFQIHGLKIILLTAFFIFLIQFISHQADLIHSTFSNIFKNTDGLLAGLNSSSRFLAVILLSYLFIITTEPNSVAYGLMQIGLPYRYGFTLITALRLVPIFIQDGQTIYFAQIIRGARYDWKKPTRAIKFVYQFLFPLLVSLIKRVDSIVISMEGRCFGYSIRRTYLHAVRFHAYDVILCLLIVAIPIVKLI